MLSQVVELIESKNSFGITSHVRPDGDSLGSSLGLYWLLRALEKDVEVIMRDAAPHSYRQLPGAGTIRVTPSADRPYDAVFVIECSDIDRPGLIDLEKQFVVNIDHHSTTELFGTVNWIDPTASACGEMVYNLCKATGVRVGKDCGGDLRQLSVAENRIVGPGAGHGAARPKRPRRLDAADFGDASADQSF